MEQIWTGEYIALPFLFISFLFHILKMNIIESSTWHMYLSDNVLVWCNNGIYNWYGIIVLSKSQFVVVTARPWGRD